MDKIRLIESLKEIIGYHIGVYFIDGGYADGILVDVKDDFLTLKYDTDETFFLSVDKIQAFSKNTKKFEVKETDHKTTHAPSLMDVIDHYKYEWVTINCQNYLSFSGVLSIIAKDYVILTDKEYKLYIQRAQIISFYPENLKVVEEKKERKQESKQQDKKKEHENKKENENKKAEQDLCKDDDQETKNQKEKKTEVIATKDTKRDSNHNQKTSPEVNHSSKQNHEAKKQTDQTSNKKEQQKPSEKDIQEKQEHLNQKIMKLFKENFAKSMESKDRSQKDSKSTNNKSKMKDTHKEEVKSKNKRERKKTVAWLGADNPAKGKTYFGIPYKHKKKKQAK